MPSRNTTRIILILTENLDPVARVSLSFAIGEVVALTALVSAAVAARTEEIAEGTETAYRVSKRTLDIGVALTLGILTLPLVMMTGLAVRLDSRGAVFFRQQRVGRNGETFGLLKIRTMKADADESVFAEHLARLQASHNQGTPAPIGRLLRKSSVDELPNLWNVLRGHMSLVGPRPLVSSEAELIGLDNPRFTVKPGITGLAQVRGRDKITLTERTKLDEEYVANRSLTLDLSILFRTMAAIFRNPGD